MKLSIIVPVYNERETILEVLKRVEALTIEKEIIIVDDFSKDGTRELLKEIRRKEMKVIYHDQNRGKGAAIRTALRYVTGDVVVIQDADLELDPRDLHRVLKPIEEGKASIVYGSRFRGGGHFPLFNLFANRFLTGFTNMLYNIHISDMETCYKCMKAEIIRNLDLKAKGFDFEPEITAKIAKRGYRIFEVPISYRMRTSSEGKKIGWRDGLHAIFYLLKYRFKE